MELGIQPGAPQILLDLVGPDRIRVCSMLVVCRSRIINRINKVLMVIHTTAGTYVSKKSRPSTC